MTNNISFSPRQPYASAHLTLTLISLEDWALVTLHGPDTQKYLQGQITIDITRLAVDQHVLCGHCNAAGKMWSNLRVFHYREGYAYILRRSVLTSQLTNIKKYAVFSSVVIAVDNDRVLLGIAGFNAREFLASIFVTLPDNAHQIIQEDDVTLLHFSEPAERFLLITTTITAEKLVTKMHNQTDLNNSRQWLVLDIEAGYPIIDIANSLQLIPQATNLQALHGISFKKGCYIGQEMIARAKFRGTNQRALYLLEGKASRVPQIAEDVELQLGEHWRRTGTVLAASMLANDMLWVQVVMHKKLNTNSKLRIRADATSHLTIKPLPYMLDS
ncbi:tRNA-modifying protein YgfZ [Candidatus Gillettellia adelgis]